MHKRIVFPFSLSITLTLAATGCAPSAIELEPDPEPLFVQPGAGNPGTPDTEPEICNPAELHVVGSYAAGGGSYEDDITGEATVRVTRPGPSVLVLSSYEPVHWTVIAEEGAIIERVILNGVYAGSATAPDGVPVDGISHKSTGTYWPIASYWPDEDERNLDCADVYPTEMCEQYEENGIDWRVATQQPDWAVDTLVTEAERVTGAALTTFHGCGALTELTIGAPGQSQGSCKAGEIDAYLAETPAEPPVDGGETCGAPLPVREVPSEGPCAGKAEAGSYRLFGCLAGGAEDESGPSIATEGIYCEEALENCTHNAALNPDLDFACTFDGEVILAAAVCES
jgi:hypothetical protein